MNGYTYHITYLNFLLYIKIHVSHGKYNMCLAVLLQAILHKSLFKHNDFGMSHTPNILFFTRCRVSVSVVGASLSGCDCAQQIDRFDWRTCGRN